MSAELTLNIPLSDGKSAYAKLRGSWDRPLVIFAHGLTGSMDRIIPYTASKFLDAHNFSFLRFNFYGARHFNARPLVECNFSTYASDLADVVAFARHQGARTIHVMGHSYGGLTILMSAHLEINSALLVDPSHPTVNPVARATFVKELNAYLNPTKGVDYLVSSRSVEQFQSLKIESYLPSYRIPSLIISADGGPLAKTNPEYAAALQSQTEIELVKIPGADHAFSSDEHLEHLLSASLNWLRRHPAE